MRAVRQFKAFGEILGRRPQPKLIAAERTDFAADDQVFLDRIPVQLAAVDLAFFRIEDFALVPAVLLRILLQFPDNVQAGS